MSVSMCGSGGSVRECVCVDFILPMTETGSVN